MNLYQTALSVTSKKFAALGDPPAFQGWMSAGSNRRLSGMNMFQRYNLDLALYETGAWATLPVGILPAWQLSVISTEGLWDSGSGRVYVYIESAGFREDLECYIGFSYREPFYSAFEYSCSAEENVFIQTAFYPENPGSVTIWLRALCVGYPPAVKIKLAVPIQTIPG
jgi:hypothetical protein